MTRQAVAFALIGAACITFGVRATNWGWLLIWVGMDFLVVALAYLNRWHRIFGKRPNGTLPLWSWAVFLPFLVYATLIWNITRFLTGGPAYHKITDDLVVGRRLLSGERPSDVDNYVDLTAEFQEPKRIRQLVGYLSFPILDNGVPDLAGLKATIASLPPGKTFVHCAQGHGRAGLFALAFLVSRRSVESVDEGLRVLQSARHRIRLNSEQRRFIERFVDAAVIGTASAR